MSDKKIKKVEIQDIKATLRDIKEKIIEKNISDYAETAYLEYAMSVVKGRAIPFIEDGLKPVHRRILYAMFKEGMTYNSVHKKSARVVGNVLGYYHPHGDQSVYEAMVRQAQPFSVRYTLIDGQGNFGSRDGDTAASMRYCFEGNTRVMTENGLIRIQDIPKLYDKNLNEFKNFGDNFNLNMNVNSLDGKSKATKWLYSGVQKVVEVITKKGYKVVCTPNEPLYTIDNNLNYVWKNVENLNVKDKISLLTKNDVIIKGGKAFNYNVLNQDILLPSSNSVEFSKLIGYLLSDGSMRINGNSLEFGSSDIDTFKDFKSLAQKLFPDNKFKERTIKPDKTTKIVATKDHYYLTINSVKIIKFLKYLGIEPSYAKDKKIPEFIFQSSKEEVAAFISAYYEGDGSISKNKTSITLALSSTSYQLLEQMKLLLLNYFGIISNKIHIDRVYQNNLSYRMHINDTEDIIIFRENIGFLSSRKKEVINSIEKLNPYSMGSKKNYVPNLSKFLTFALNELEISKKYMITENGEKFLKQELFPNLSLRNFKNLKYKSKLKIYLNQWTEDAKNKLPILYKKLLNIIDKDYYYDEIVSIKFLDEDVPVYDLTVDKTHAFVANGFIAHNTEAKLAAITQMYMDEIRDHCVDFVPNYDGSEEEPQFLPARLPFILLNGNPGIGVGMASDVPHHNLTEVVQATIACLENEDITLDEVLEYIKGPDFPTKGQIISSKTEIKKMYAEGRGSIKLRSKYVIETEGKNWKLIFNEIPFGVSGKKVMEEVDAHFNPEDKLKKDGKGKDKKITLEQARLKALYISLIDRYNDASDKDNPIRLVFEPKSNKQDPEELVQILLGTTSLETSYSANFTVVGRDGRPTQKSLMEIIFEWISFRKDTVKRRVEYHLLKIAEKLHILEGRKIILNHIDEVIQIVKHSEKPKEDLMEKYGLSEIQAIDVLDLRLKQLGKLELDSIEKEMNELFKKREDLQKIIATEKSLKKQIIKEMTADMEKFGDERLTEIIEAPKVDLSLLQEKTAKISEEDITVAISDKGWAKVIKGKKNPEEISFKEGDSLNYHFYCKNTDTLGIFDTDGKVYNYPLHEINGKDGSPINTLVQIGNKFSIAFPFNKDFKYVLSHDKGLGFVIKGENLIVKMKAGKEIFKDVTEKKIAQPLYFSNIEDISEVYFGVLNTENKFLTYKLTEIPEYPKGKGIVLGGLNEGQTIKEVVLIRNKDISFVVTSKNDNVSEISIQKDFDSYIKGRSAKGQALPIKLKEATVTIKRN